MRRDTLLRGRPGPAGPARVVPAAGGAGLTARLVLLLTLVVGLVAGGVAPPDVASAEPPATRDTVADRVLVRWVDGVPAAVRRSHLDAVVGGLGADRAAGSGGSDVEVERLSPRVDAVRLRSVPVDAFVAAARALDVVELVERDRVLAAPAQETGLPVTVPNDELFAFQWGLRNTGQPVGPMDNVVDAIEGIDIRLLEAWETTRGTPDTVVAVIDTLVDDTHPDLIGALAGSIDVAPAPTGSKAHGTGVASVIAARADDGVGMVGVAPGVRILSVAAFAGEATGPGSSTLAAVVSAFEAARSAGADVINASWVASQDSPMLRAAIADAGVPVIAASGNEGMFLTGSSRVFPAVYELPNLLTVTSIGPLGSVPAFANIGPDRVDVAAPGEAVLVADEGTEYLWADGTSFAAPHVAGAVALAVTVAPYTSTTDVLDAVRWTSRPLPSLDGSVITGGMLDVEALVRGVQRPLCRADLVVPAGFGDTTGNVHRSSIDCLVQYEVMTGRGDGRFEPAALVTREQVASALARLIERTLDLPPAAPAGYLDVAESNVHAAAIDRLSELGIVRGRADGTFRPRDPVTRGQLASMVVATHQVLTGATVGPSRVWFIDTQGTTHAASIDRARDLGVVRGVSRLAYDPASSTRRDQVASLLSRLLDALAREGVMP